MKKLSIWLIAITATIFIAAGSLYWYIHSTVQDYENSFYPNVTIEGVNVSKLSKEDGQKELVDVLENYNQMNIDVSAGDQTFQKQLQYFNVQYNLEEQLDAAFQFGKNKSLLEQYKLIKDKKGQSFSISYTIDKTLLNDWVTEIEEAIATSPQDATMKIRNGQVNVTNDIKGYKINQEQLKQDIIESLDANSKDDISVVALLDEIPARITADTLKNVRHVIGSFTTHYSSSDANRNYNIKLSTETIDSFLLMPGESFSFNEFVGDTTADKGYKPAGSFLDGEVVNSYGGGVCQVSTTLYNAIVKGGIIPDVRFNHSMRVYYVPIGMDAAIAYPYKDLAFTNPYDKPVYIEGTVSPTSVTFTIYSTEDTKESNTDFQLSSSIVSSNGGKTRSVTYLEKISNGKVVDRKVLSNDTYVAQR